MAGGGVRYSGAGRTLVELAERHGVPVVDTPAGRTLLPHDHPLYGGPLGIIGSASANTLAGEADVVVAVGTRLQDFTTASWTVFADDVSVVHVNAARFDAVKHGGQAAGRRRARCARGPRGRAGRAGASTRPGAPVPPRSGPGGTSTSTGCGPARPRTGR